MWNYLEQLQGGRVGREGELCADDGGLVPAAEGGGGAGLGGLDGGPRRLRVVAVTVVDAVVEDEVVLRLEVQQVHRAPLAPAVYGGNRVVTNIIGYRQVM